jgi:alpha-D-xyloside xylohydrolase
VVTLGKREGDGSGAPATREFIIRRVDAAHPNADALDASRDVKVEYRGSEVAVRS